MAVDDSRWQELVIQTTFCYGDRFQGRLLRWMIGHVEGKPADRIPRSAAVYMQDFKEKKQEAEGKNYAKTIRMRT